MKLDSTYAEYFPEYSSYFGTVLILFKYIYGMNNSENLFADGFTDWLIETGFIQYQC